MELTIERLEKEHKDLFDQVFNQGAEAERARVIEIMDADGDAIESRKMIVAGTPASDCYRKLYEAEKKKKALGLENMAAEAPQSQGTEVPQEPEATDNRPADVVLAERAKALMAEKELTFEAASRLVMRDDPDLKRKYRELYSV